MAFWFDQAMTSGRNSHGLDRVLLHSGVLKRIKRQVGSYLLPQAFPEGCPLHPSYPQMHGMTVGSGGAVLKAWFDNDFELDEWVPSADGTQLVASGNKVRVGHEIDKLVSNIAQFRDAAGVHFKSDGIACDVGEEVGIAMLRDTVQRYPNGTAFEFRKRDGQLVRISNSKPRPLE